MDEEEFESGLQFATSARGKPQARDLLALARARIKSGEIPGVPSTTSLGGPSGGATCDLCGVDIVPGSPEIEVCGSRPGQKRRVLLMHPLCFGAWAAAAREAGTPD